MVFTERGDQILLALGVGGAPGWAAVSHGANSSAPQGCDPWSPLVDPHGNALSPCFVALVFAVVACCTAVPAAVGLYQSLVAEPHFGKLDAKKAVHFIRVNSVVLQGVLYAIIASRFAAASVSAGDVRVVAYGATAAVVLLLLAPLHLVEIRSRVIPSAVLLVFWPVNVLLNAAVLLQQSFSEHDVLSVPHLDALLVANAVSVFVLEYLRYAPTPELLEHCAENGIATDTPDIISRATFSYINPLMSQGVTDKSITEEDIMDPLDLDSAEIAAAKVSRNWERQRRSGRKKPSLGLAVAVSLAGTLAHSMSLEFVENVLSFAQPQFLRLLIKFFAPSTDAPLVAGFAVAGAMFVCSIVRTTIISKYFMLNFEASTRAKAGLMSLIYQKSLRLSPEARAEKTTGDIINLMSVDVARVQEMGSYLAQLVAAPLKLVLCLVSLNSLLGNALWGGVLVMLVMIPLNTVLVKSMRRLHKQQMVYKDKRSRLVNEILTSIKSIKLYSWEKPMLHRLRDVRNNQELGNMKKIGVASAFVNFSWNSVPFMVSCASFSIYAFTSKSPLTSDLIFPALSLFDLLGEPILAVPSVITGLIELNIALARISSFLLASEVDDSYVSREPPVLHKGLVSLEIKNAAFYWSKPHTEADVVRDEESELVSPKVALAGVDFEARKGALNCIVGRVGAGKSTFMQAILGELACAPVDPARPVTFSVRGDIAYCAQVPWIMNASVRDNILFGKRYEEDFYQRTIRACQLLDDLDVLPDGDATMVGEKGISLSGGQKARISLARAVYKRSDIYLLDDILSAVDAHVGKSITDQVLSRHGLLASKTVILATNSVPVLSHSGNITLLDHGEIREQGSFKEVVAAKGALYELIKEYGKEQAQDSGADFAVPLEKILESGDAALGDAVGAAVGASSGESPAETAAEESTENSTDDAEKALDELEAYEVDIPLTDTTEPLARTVSHVTLRRPSTATFRRMPLNFDKDSRKTAQEKEKMETGRVNWDVYKAYARACSLSGVAAFMAFILASASFGVLSTYWLKHWSEQNGKSGSNDHAGMYVGIYTLLGITANLFGLANSVVMWFMCSIRASMTLHDDMSKAILRAPMSFFETTPVGRVMNRFSNDINKIDEYLPRTFTMFFKNGIATFFTILIISWSMPQFLLIMAVLSLSYFYFQKFFMATSRQLKRMQSVSISPIFAHLQETLNGRETIRAYDEIDRFQFLNAAHIDFNMKMFYAIRAVNRWLTTRLQFIGSVIIFSASSLAILTKLGPNPMTGGMVGLVMSYALQITGTLNWMVRMSVEVETSIVSVERVLEYTNLKSEAPEVVEGHRPPAYWPSRGAIKFDHYSTKYRAKLDPVLNDITLEIKPEEKIGIVGRTGAGKSTLASAVYRLIEPTEGHITIDDYNTSDIGLYDLRHKLSIIPQDSQILEGTVRQNLDPFDEYTDEQLWSALKLSHLEDVVHGMSSDEENVGLQAKLSEGGSNLSVGQRQLVCLARALLSTSKILILDEATAAVDVQTDKILQETIRTEFKHKTILTIAHRLDTVMDSDKIIVLDKGRVKEFDSPANLLKNKEGIFYSLCEQGGYLKDDE